MSRVLAPTYRNGLPFVIPTTAMQYTMVDGVKTEDKEVPIEEWDSTMFEHTWTEHYEQLVDEGEPTEHTETMDFTGNYSVASNSTDYITPVVGAGTAWIEVTLAQAAALVWRARRWTPSYDSISISVSMTSPASWTSTINSGGTLSQTTIDDGNEQTLLLRQVASCIPNVLFFEATDEHNLTGNIYGPETTAYKDAFRGIVTDGQTRIFFNTLSLYRPDFSYDGNVFGGGGSYSHYIFCAGAPVSYSGSWTSSHGFFDPGTFGASNGVGYETSNAGTCSLTIKCKEVDDMYVSLPMVNVAQWDYYNEFPYSFSVSADITATVEPSKYWPGSGLWDEDTGAWIGEP